MRGLATIAVLVSSGQHDELGYYVDKALDDGLTAGEISETITHLAFYSGWQNAMEAVPVVADVFKKRRIGTDQLPEANPELFPQDEAAEADRAANVQRQYGEVSQGVVDDTPNVLFNDLWLRPGLKLRDRSLVGPQPCRLLHRLAESLHCHASHPQRRQLGVRAAAAIPQPTSSVYARRAGVTLA
ncbi:carboxymuconolactone decarboxylase family protein [Kribbella shirazensis]|uniref:Alkylhydroperoxidase/carboxymuconolactone decarboxylase family protein YurZ n=1 Tax=Kribbella shirazensis TaxID=1105143 RepID=A0A7X5VHY0_9ACTN|nr:alkylhydroperoxidase/carboxymuconolactone decarboxylase family protein YurZ [Kribbella shirazensis]